jgi:hypothetical protein
VTARKRVVERYIEGFRTGDHEMILGCLTDDVTWDMPPHFSLSGSAARHSRGTADRNGGKSSSSPSASTW